MNLPDTINAWLTANPAIAEYFNQLNNKNIRWAIFAGAAVSLLTGNRQPTDIDIIVHDDDFTTAAQLTPHAQRKLPLECELPTGDNKMLHYKGSELWFSLDGKEIEIMSHAQKSIEGHGYNISFTDLAVKNRMTIRTDGPTVYLANPFDTMAIKAIMQRGPKQHKFDFEDTKALAKQCTFSAEYITKRSAQIHLGAREFTFLQKAGLHL
ncbi:MAG TPA: hypothetical protein VFO38_00810 [Candidatus Saccharimonadales bacterium]|nr:hypothetical protein [Candidatus Saccharimonadales bacterium]